MCFGFLPVYFALHGIRLVLNLKRRRISISGTDLLELDASQACRLLESASLLGLATVLAACAWLASIHHPCLCRPMPDLRSGAINASMDLRYVEYQFIISLEVAEEWLTKSRNRSLTASQPPPINTEPRHLSAHGLPKRGIQHSHGYGEA